MPIDDSLREKLVDAMKAARKYPAIFTVLNVLGVAIVSGNVSELALHCRSWVIQGSMEGEDL